MAAQRRKPEGGGGQGSGQGGQVNQWEIELEKELRQYRANMQTDLDNLDKKIKGLEQKIAENEQAYKQKLDDLKEDRKVNSAEWVSKPKANLVSASLTLLDVGFTGLSFSVTGASISFELVGVAVGMYKAGQWISYDSEAVFKNCASAEEQVADVVFSDLTGTESVNKLMEILKSVMEYDITLSNVRN